MPTRAAHPHPHESGPSLAGAGQDPNAQVVRAGSEPTAPAVATREGVMGQVPPQGVRWRGQGDTDTHAVTGSRAKSLEVSGLEHLPFRNLG